MINIITARVEEIFELVNKKLDEHGLRGITNHRVVLTGGCSHLTGIRNLASIILEKQVRLGAPKNIANMPQALCSPEFATVVGLVLFAANEEKKNNMEKIRTSTQNNASGGLFSRIFNRLKQNF